MPSADCIRLEVPEFAVREFAGLRHCDCRLCKRVRGKVAVPACPCDACRKATDDDRKVWERARHVNKCECCGATWLAHSRANICPTCWPLDLCRVCWRRPGLICAVCAAHLDTPYGD